MDHNHNSQINNLPSLAYEASGGPRGPSPQRSQGSSTSRPKWISATLEIASKIKLGRDGSKYSASPPSPRKPIVKKVTPSKPGPISKAKEMFKNTLHAVNLGRHQTQPTGLGVDISGQYTTENRSKTSFVPPLRQSPPPSTYSVPQAIDKAMALRNEMENDRMLGNDTTATLMPDFNASDSKDKCTGHKHDTAIKTSDGFSTKHKWPYWSTSEGDIVTSPRTGHLGRYVSTFDDPSSRIEGSVQEIKGKEVNGTIDPFAMSTGEKPVESVFCSPPSSPFSGPVTDWEGTVIPANVGEKPYAEALSTEECTLELELLPDSGRLNTLPFLTSIRAYGEFGRYPVFNSSESGYNGTKANVTSPMGRNPSSRSLAVRSKSLSAISHTKTANSGRDVNLKIDSAGNYRYGSIPPSLQPAQSSIENDAAKTSVLTEDLVRAQPRSIVAESASSENGTPALTADGTTSPDVSPLLLRRHFLPMGDGSAVNVNALSADTTVNPVGADSTPECAHVFGPGSVGMLTHQGLRRTPALRGAISFNHSRPTRLVNSPELRRPSLKNGSTVASGRSSDSSEGVESVLNKFPLPPLSSPLLQSALVAEMPLQTLASPRLANSQATCNKDGQFAEIAPFDGGFDTLGALPKASIKSTSSDENGDSTLSNGQNNLAAVSAAPAPEEDTFHRSDFSYMFEGDEALPTLPNILDSLLFAPTSLTPKVSEHESILDIYEDSISSRKMYKYLNNVTHRVLKVRREVAASLVERKDEFSPGMQATEGKDLNFTANGGIGSSDDVGLSSPNFISPQDHEEFSTVGMVQVKRRVPPSPIEGRMQPSVIAKIKRPTVYASTPLSTPVSHLASVPRSAMKSPGVPKSPGEVTTKQGNAVRRYISTHD